MINKYQKIFKQEEEEGRFWPSFTDLLTTILLCFILIFIVMMVIKSLEIKEMKKTIDQIMGVRSELVKDLKDTFGENKQGMEVDEKTGAIIFDTEILFAYDDATLKKNSYTFLDEFVPVYLEVSQNRAHSVAEYNLSEKFPYKHLQQHVEEKLTVNSKSYSDFRTDEGGNYDASLSRRVEFKFRLKDEEILEKTREILGD